MTEERQEFMRKSFRNKLKKDLPASCVNCGKNKTIQYHHIVPLVNSGTNKLSNIVPLCPDCHAKAHDKAWKYGNTGSRGRPKVVKYDDAEKYLHEYYRLGIGTKECKKKIGISENSRSSWYRLREEYEKKHDVAKDFYNNLDLKSARNGR